MIIKNAFWIILRLIQYRLARNNLIKSPLPILLNFSVTNKCQSHCTSCNIWKLYKQKPEMEKKELKTWEIEKIFKTMDKIFLFNICGGEPFLRDDLAEICRLAVKYLKPNVIHIPTNCLSPQRIEKTTKQILKNIGNTSLTIKMSLDGIGKDHDKIRGVKGNFERVLETYQILKKIRNVYPNLYVDAGATVSKNNINKLKQIEDYVQANMDLDNFLHELADTRAELFTIDITQKNIEKFKGIMKNLNITPTGQQYTDVIDYLCSQVLKNLKTRRKLSKITQALRIVYYKRAAKAMKEKRRITPCYAGISNAHINPWGSVWICNVQAFKHEIGNLRDYNYDFRKLWYSKQAGEVRKWVKEEHCFCPLVGQAFLDTIMNPSELMKVFYYYL